LDREFQFDFDPCPANSGWWRSDGLIDEWGQRSFCNPPYGNQIPRWISKAYEEYLKGKLVVLLIPSRTDTAWWHDYVMKATEIRFIRGRLKFKGATNSAPFPSCIVVFRGDDDKT
jgi:site-specific DNA-methyltransferase (adenine-specific)